MLIQLKLMEQDDMDAGYESLPVHDPRILTKVECIGVERRTKPSKHHVYVLVVCWSDGVKYPIYRRYISFFDLKICIKEEFKDHPNFKEPELPALKQFERGWLFGSKESAMDKRKKYINTFCLQVLQQPEEVVRSNSVESFYDAWESDYDQHNHAPRQSTGESPGRGRKFSAPTIQPFIPRQDSQTNNADTKYSKYQDRPIPDLQEMPPRRARAASMVLDSWQPDGHPSNSALSLPRGMNLMTLPDEPLGLPYRANCDYEKRRPGEITLRKGHLVEVLEKSNSGWWFVHLEGPDGVGAHEQGWAPGAFLDRVGSSSSRLLKTVSLCGEPKKDDDELCGIYETICDFRAREEDEISYTQGQKVEVISTGSDGWWRIRTEEETEGFTPAMNLKNTDKRSKPAEEESQFRKRSLRGRGPPPRRSTKGRDHTRSYPENKTIGDLEIPLYAQIMKPQRTPAMVGHGRNTPTEIIPSGTDGRNASIPGNQSRELNYTEVVFPKKQGEPSAKTSSPRIRRQNRVEYAEINPRPLPAASNNGNKTNRTSPPHFYDSSAAQIQQQPDHHHHQHLIRQQPQQLYENVDSEKFIQSTHSSVSVEHTVKQHDHHQLPPPPQSDLDPVVPHSESSSVQERTTSSPSTHTQDHNKIHPVPKPRLKQPRTAAIVHNYENTGDLPGRKWGDTVRPQEALPPQQPKPKETVQDSNTHSLPRIKLGHTYDNAKYARSSYENTAVGIANDIILSHSTSTKKKHTTQSLDSITRPSHPSPQTTGSNISVEDKMAGFDIFPHAKSMNPILNDYMVQLPQAPSIEAPGLPPEAAIWWSKIPELGDSNMIEAIWDYEVPKGASGILSFKKSDVGVKVSKENNGWLGAKIGDRVGWVPILFWATYVPNPGSSRRGIKNIKQAEALHESKAWFLGKMTRQQAEDMLDNHGQHRDFLVRESTNRVGDLTLSVKDKERIRHFPIQMTQSGKYDIGKAHFTDLTKVIAYYQANPLFYDDQSNNEPVSLGKPINRPKNT